MKNWVIIGLMTVISSAFSQNLTNRIDDYITSYSVAGDFSGCVLVSKEDNIIYRECFGYADDLNEIENTEDSKFLIGSISKQFTAAAILILEQDGLVQLEQNISEFFPSHPIAEEITLHHLLTHTSGLTDIFNIPGLDNANNNWTLKKLAHLILDTEPDFEPGSNYSYSNGGYAILAHIIEKVSEMSYGDFLKQYVLDPLGMSQTGHPSSLDAVSSLAIGYDPIDFDNRIPTTLIEIELLKGSGSLYSTVKDLNTWINSLKSRSLLESRSYEKFFKNHGSNYGYGISVYKSMDRSVFGHDGRISGYIADYLHYEEDDISIIILGNIQTGVADFFRRDIAAIVFNKPYSNKVNNISPASESPIDIPLIEGVYSFGPNFKVYIDYTDNRIMAKANEGAYSELVPLTDDRFFNRTLYSFITFERNESGSVVKMIWTNNDGNSFEGKKE